MMSSYVPFSKMALSNVWVPFATYEIDEYNAYTVKLGKYMGELNIGRRANNVFKELHVLRGCVLPA